MAEQKKESPREAAQIREDADTYLKTCLYHPFFTNPEFSIFPLGTFLSQEEQTTTVKNQDDFFDKMGKFRNFMQQNKGSAGLNVVRDFQEGAFSGTPANADQVSLQRNAQIISAFLADNQDILKQFHSIVFQDTNLQSIFLEGFFRIKEPQILLFLAELVHKKNIVKKPETPEVDYYTLMSTVGKKYKGFAYMELGRFADAQRMFEECINEFIQLQPLIDDSQTRRICAQYSIQCRECMNACINAQSLPKDQAAIHTQVLQLITLPT